MADLDQDLETEAEIKSVSLCSSQGFFFLYQQILPYLHIDLGLQRSRIFHSEKAALYSVDKCLLYTIVGETLRILNQLLHKRGLVGNCSE